MVMGLQVYGNKSQAKTKVDFLAKLFRVIV
jgi:hypothetical protein